MDDLMPFFIGMGVIFAGILVLAYVVKMLEIRRSRTWKTTTGKIIQSKVQARKRKDMDGKSIHENVPYVLYEYEVGDRRYQSARISFAERITGADLEAALARYPVGKTVQVAYNPEKPGEATLEREMPAAVGISVSLLAVFFVAAGLLIPLSLGGAADWLAPRLPNPDRAPIIIFLGGMGFLILFLSLFVQREVWEARDWSTVQGQVISAESEEYRTWSTNNDHGVMSRYFRPSIVYLFTVNGRSYISDRVTFGGYAGWSSSVFFRHRLEQYPEGSPVTVYYNPINPSAAVLERRAWSLPLLLGAGILLIMMSVLFSGLL